MKKFVFTLKSFNRLWEHLDVEEKAKLLVDICGFCEKQRQAILLINDKNIYGSSSKKAIEILGFNDHRDFERYRKKTIQRILNILNSPKHNEYYAKFIKN